MPSLTVADGAEDGFMAVDCLELITGTDGPVLSEYARGQLEPLLGPAGEFWPVDVLGRRYWWFNCLASIPVLDRRHTEAEWSVVEGDWGTFRWITSTRRLAFKADLLAAAPAMFRIPEYPQGVLFGTEALESAIRRSSLTGFQLELVWSSENGGVLDPSGLGFGTLFSEPDRAETTKRRAAAARVLEQRHSLRH